jgi:hypothetical protein
MTSLPICTWLQLDSRLKMQNVSGLLLVTGFTA